MAAPSNLLPTLVFVPLVGLALYRRFTTSVGRQPLIPARMILRSVLFAAFSTAFLVSAPSPSAALAAAGGVSVGLALAFVGLRHTTIEATPRGKFYTPNRWLGLIVTALFIGRFAARMVTMSKEAEIAHAEGQTYIPQQSALTVGLLCLMAGYYVAYYIGVLVRARSVVPATATTTTTTV